MPNPMLNGITRNKRKKINIVLWSRPKSLFHVRPEWTSNVIYCETRRGQGSEHIFERHLRTEPLFSHHIPVYTSYKPTLVRPGPFVNTCLLVLLLIRHTHKYWSLQIFWHCPPCQSRNLDKIRGRVEEIGLAMCCGMTPSLFFLTACVCLCRLFLFEGHCLIIHY